MSICLLTHRYSGCQQHAPRLISVGNQPLRVQLPRWRHVLLGTLCSQNLYNDSQCRSPTYPTSGILNARATLYPPFALRHLRTQYIWHLSQKSFRCVVFHAVFLCQGSKAIRPRDMGRVQRLTSWARDMPTLATDTVRASGCRGLEVRVVAESKILILRLQDPKIYICMGGIVHTGIV